MREEKLGASSTEDWEAESGLENEPDRAAVNDDADDLMRWMTFQLGDDQLRESDSENRAWLIRGILFSAIVGGAVLLFAVLCVLLYVL